MVQPAAKKGVPRSAGIPKAEKFFHLYLREVGRVRALSPAKQVELAVRAGGGDKQARGQLLRGSLPLVVQIAREYDNGSLPLLELVSEGNFGLLQAVERFDAVKEGDFHTFASWWVHRAIKRALAREPKPVPVPIRFMARPVRALVGSG